MSAASRFSRTNMIIAGLGLLILAVTITLGIATSRLLRSVTTFPVETVLVQERTPPARKPAPDELRNPLLRMFHEGIVGDKTLEDADRDRTTQILREADPLLLRVKQENRKALNQMHQKSPRFHKHVEPQRTGEDYSL